MNKDNAPLYLPVVKALAEGKTIQCNFGGGRWKDVCEINFFEAPDEYRVKPEPRTFDVWIKKEDGTFHNRNSYFGKLNSPEDFERITVQEVLK